MPVFVALLRGINVSGQKKIAMADLKLLFESLAFTDVQTYIQSGNVIFHTELPDRREVIRIIEARIQENYGFPVSVILRTRQELAEVMESNPKPDTPDRTYVTFLADDPPADKLEKLQAMDFSPEAFQVIRQEIFLYCPHGYGTSKLSNNFFETKLKVIATTRNWRTVTILHERMPA